MNRRARTILWFDGGAACTAGIAMLVVRDWLSRVHAFPVALVVFVGVCNLAYASYSGTLATLASRGRPPSRRAIDVLVVANLTWTLVCGVIVAATWRTGSVLGLLHVALEGVLVGSLGMVERRLVRPFAR